MDVKHAYCIMAHGKFHQLQRLLDAIDDERNDIYLHIDKKCNDNIDILHTQKSKLIFTRRLDVRWSDISLADAEIVLFKKVLEGGTYDRIHLISGVDLPLKSQDEIHAFFSKHKNEEFIDIRTDTLFLKRIKYYHFFVRNRRNHPFIDFSRRVLLIPQLLFINRLRKVPLKYAYGWEWCSLTQKAVQEIVTKYTEYRSLFKYTTCSDELYKQMILYTNKYFRISSLGPLRYIIFTSKSPSPQTLQMKDYANIVSSNCLFARKFDEDVDKEIIDKIIHKLKKNEMEKNSDNNLKEINR